MENWTTKNIPDLSNKIIIVTGANSGIGYEITKALAHNNAEIIMACRNTEKGEEAKKQILIHKPDAKISVMLLDLSRLQTVKDFADNLRLKYNRIDVLINNAGVMAQPKSVTSDGFEKQFGTNHIGHFVLTAKLFPLMRKTEGSRIVTVSSLASHRGKIHFEDINFTHKYHRWRTYQQSKLANLMFALELDKQLTTSTFKTRSYAAHPGVSESNLFLNAKPGRFLKAIGKLIMPFIAQPASKGALPILYAATSPDAIPGMFYGPDGRREHKGFPKEAFIPETAKNQEERKKLWSVTEELAGTQFHVCQGKKEEEPAAKVRYQQM